MARRKDHGSDARVHRIRGREADENKPLVVQHPTRAGAADLGSDPDRASVADTEKLVNSRDLIEVPRVHDIRTGQRRTVVLPADLCRRLGITEGTPLRLIEHAGAFEVIPMRLVVAHEDPGHALEALLDRVTPENTHGEVDTGPSVGQES